MIAILAFWLIRAAEIGFGIVFFLGFCAAIGIGWHYAARAWDWLKRDRP